MNDKPSIETTHWTTGAWRLSKNPAPGSPPHVAPMDQYTHGRAKLDIVWADERRTVPLKVRDYDGCEADVLGRKLGDSEA